MIIDEAVRFRCDAIDCPKRLPRELNRFVPRLKMAKVLAANGWTSTRDGDFCPTHTAALRPVEARP